MTKPYSKLLFAIVVIAVSILAGEDPQLLLDPQLLIGKIREWIPTLFNPIPLPPSPPPPAVSQLDIFTNSTTDLFRDINLAEIPSPDEITQHVTLCDRVATILERNKAYSETGKTTASSLRSLSELLFDAGDAIREMFAESNSVHRTFNIEVEAMIREIQTVKNLFFHNPEYFENRIMKLEITLKDFVEIVNKAVNSIAEARSWRNKVEGRLIDSQQEALNYQHTTWESRNELDLTNQSIDAIKIMVKHIQEMADGLKQIRDKLTDYRITMRKVHQNLKRGHRVTNEELQHLKAAVESWNESHKKFLEKQRLRVIHV